MIAVAAISRHPSTMFYVARVLCRNSRETFSIQKSMENENDNDIHKENSSVVAIFIRSLWLVAVTCCNIQAHCFFPSSFFIFRSRQTEEKSTAKAVCANRRTTKRPNRSTERPTNRTNGGANAKLVTMAIDELWKNWLNEVYRHPLI